MNTLTRLKGLAGGDLPPLRIEVFSQGDPSMFDDLRALGAELRLDEPAVTTHRAMVEADILVMSKGAFSYTAGVLNDGITLYDPQKYRALHDWIVRAPDGSFDAGARRGAPGGEVRQLAAGSRLAPDDDVLSHLDEIGAGGFKVNAPELRELLLRADL